jgi:hypothetical protein
MKNEQAPTKDQLRVLVCGGRDYSDASRVDVVLRGIEPDVIIHGGASGADRLAGQWAWKNGKGCRVEFADWQLHGKAAGPIRNQKMLDEHAPDLVVAFPGGRGTADMVRRAKAKGVPVIELESMA